MSFENEIAIAFVTICAAVLAGISWNTLGIWQVYRDSGIKAVDWLKVRKNVIIGTVLGIIGYGVALSGNIGLVEITSLDSFIAVVIAFFPLIVIADKIFTRKLTASSVNVAKTN